jgi:hypothetical protein
MHQLLTSHFQESAYYTGIKIFNILPSSLTILINEKIQFKVPVKRYLITHSFYSVDEFVNLQITHNACKGFLVLIYYKLVLQFINCVWIYL